jgi:endonuclease YncB( thermonuclease family)
MIYKYLFNFILLLCLLTPSIPLHAAITGKVVSISDGDTITILDSTRTQHKIRLWGIDCPESGQDFGKKAKQFTSSMVFGKTVSVITEDTDKYGRTVGIVKIDGKTLNEELIKAGFAWVYVQYCNKPVCDQWKRYEEAARRGKAGLWAQSNAIPPWEFRHGTKLARTPIISPIKIPGAYHGNTKSMVFHKPGCKAYGCKNCTEVFTSREMAIKAGFRPCGECRP